ICEDIWQDGGPVAGYRDLDALLVLNGSPFEHGKRAARERLTAVRAREIGAPVGYVNLVGGQDDLVFDGSSFVSGADSGVVAAAPSFTEHLLVIDLDDDGAVHRPGGARPGAPSAPTAGMHDDDAMG